nr:RNA-directed DNA polymerase, eukaryota [Tanacetum cinerariifolium]
MGDFNEVRFAGERMGSIFNVRGARDFNSFISSSGLVDVQLEGYSFTWSHPTVAKMSKLHRFLISEGFVSLFPHVSAICLDKHLSDHCPILLRDDISDYGATPFRFYHSWFKLNGFEQMVINTWNSISLEDRNGMIHFKKKLQLLKKEIRSWVANYKKDQSRSVIKSTEDCDRVQKAKIQWAIEGDENSKFYHGIINRKRANLSIKGIMVDGEWLSKFLIPKSSKLDQAADLEIPITRDEIRTDVWNCGDNKSPGPDGFTFEFFRKFWDVIGADFVLQLNGSSNIARLLRGVDFAKAYNSIRQDYLDDVLDSFSFGSKWRSWISGSLLSGMTSIIINGSPTSEFQLHLGLKQGDPLAPYLFILVMESLHLSITKATDAGLFKGIKIDSSLMISHLFYADDAVFIGEWSEKNVENIMHILHCFSFVSGLKINLHKSHLLGVGISPEIVNAAAMSLGCLVMRALFKYLGAMVGGNMSLVKSCDEIIGKLNSRLSKWKCSTLSIGEDSLFSSRAVNKITWVKWSKVLAAKKYDGLGVSSYFALNRALLFKWVWRFTVRDNTLGIILMILGGYAWYYKYAYIEDGVTFIAKAV